MKKLTIGLLGLSLLLVNVAAVHAAPNNKNKAEHNPNTVAYYAPGTHTIPTDPIHYGLEGTNIVTMRGNSGQIQAWYTGTDVNYHSVWNVAKKGSCPSGWLLVEDAYPGWGDYLTPDTDYCVKVNAF